MASQGLSDVFKTYAGFGTRQTSTELDGAKFVKVFKDCGLVGKGLSSTELDIIFSKVCGTRAVMILVHGPACSMSEYGMLSTPSGRTLSIDPCSWRR